MTIVFTKPTNTPGTHALVIGVGAYTHLGGGLGQLMPASSGMGQLSSPSRSANAFADWLQHQYNYASAPLATLDLLVSDPASPGSAQITGIEQIATAVESLCDRADMHPENRVIFYFCGHGLAAGPDTALLASDFAATKYNPFAGAIDFTALVDGMARLAASNQLYFVDACRTENGLISEAGTVGRVLVSQAARSKSIPTLQRAIYQSTVEGDRAQSRNHDVSLFTSAVLRALKGAGADSTDDRTWDIMSSRLQEAVTYYMNDPHYSGELAGEQVATGKEMATFRFHRLPGLPVVPVTVTCLPDADNRDGHFTCHIDGKTEPHRIRLPAAGDNGQAPHTWPLELEFGEYVFEVKVPDNRVGRSTMHVRPVSRTVEVTMEV